MGRQVRGDKEYGYAGGFGGTSGVVAGLMELTCDEDSY